MIHGRIGKDAFLGGDVDLYFHAPYYGFSSAGNTIKYINYLKNDRRDYDRVITQCEDIAAKVLAADLAELVSMYGPLTVCAIPRSKRESAYPPEKMGLKRAIRKAIAMNPNLADGMDYIVRHTNTLCTHRGVGIDEDGVQALFDAGAASVIMYAFGCTARRSYCKCA